MSYKPEIQLSNCNPNIYKSLERTACNTSRGGKKRRKQKGGNRCLVPNNPTPSSYWPGPPNPAPPNPVPSPSCQLPHFRPLVLSQFGGNPYRHPDSRPRSTRRSRRITATHTRENGTTGGKKYKRHTRKAKKYKRHTYKR